MLDLKWIREHPEAFDAAMRRRGLAPKSGAVLDLDEDRRLALAEAQELQAARNRASKLIAEAKARGNEARARALVDEVALYKDRLQEAEERARGFDRAVERLLVELPNLPAEDVPEGPDETANRMVRRVGEPRRFDFRPRPHEELGEALGQMDFAGASRMSGARFVALSGPLARLERALANFMLDLQTGEYGYREVSPPYLVREAAVFGTGQLPKFAEDLFRTTDGFWLIPTAEVPLSNLVRERILEEAALPIRLAAYTPCFRAEAGAAGRDTRGMMRMHQFMKVELVSITHPDQSEDELERMTACAEEVLKRLELPYRVMLLSTGDMGFAARKTYDLEVWLPAQETYREISSCSNCGDFQARRMDARFRPAGGRGTRYVHTLNGSGLAVGRTLVAVLENFQNADGAVGVPAALRPYMDGTALIGRR